MNSDPNQMNKNVFHIIAEYKSIDMFKIMITEGRKRVSLAKVK